MASQPAVVLGRGEPLLQDLVRLGEPESVGQHLIPIVAGDARDCNYSGLIPYMAPQEIQVSSV